MTRYRKSTRLSGYDYSLPNAYFVTICVEKRMCCLATIQNTKIQLTPSGEIADQTWKITHEYFDDICIDTHITMPNHVHAIIMILTPRRGGVTPPLHRIVALGDIVGFYKYQTTKQINILTKTPGKLFWQRKTYDHIIRDNHDLNHYRNYIDQNPIRWELDRYYATT